MPIVCLPIIWVVNINICQVIEVTETKATALLAMTSGAIAIAYLQQMGKPLEKTLT